MFLAILFSDSNFIIQERLYLMKKCLFYLCLCGAVVLSAAQVKMVSHRGEEFSAPEASRTAFEQAMKLKADVIKLDIHSSKDGVVVLSHDPTLKRTMLWNVKIADTTYEQLAQGVFVPVNGVKNEKLLTLEQGVEIVKSAPEFWLDVKDKKPETLDKALQIMFKANIKPEQIMIATFAQNVLEYGKTKYPDIRRVKHITLRKLYKGKYKGRLNGNVRPNVYNDAAAFTKALLAEQKRLGLYGYNLPLKGFKNNLYTAGELKKLRQNKVWCAVYYAHTAEQAKDALKLGADAWVTGSIAAAKSVVNNAAE